MKTELSIVAQFELLIEKERDTLIKRQSFQKLNEANNRHNHLIETGVIKKRGYTLRGIEDVHLYRRKI
ncbi:hypothetical protein [Aquirufa rosea]|uniref:Uncharacterized protein n=1 Tax=Aquirufa rosea TaxID=2509241 RepID=A0A4Q1C0Y1_9BACT|nr:hypothetical protein [Aquirufa rosea]RXK50772.1 hypothetical protein ESB04_03735 [Aquirufa rosea]